VANTNVRVPFVDLRVHHEFLQAEIETAIRQVAERCDFILGDEVHAFESEFASYCGANHAVGVASGTAALEMLLRASGIAAGDEVIVPAFTFYATAYAVASVGARPVLADCDLETANLDPAAAAAAVTPRTKAILAVHLYGRPAAMDALAKISRSARVLLLEDACQAHGARYGDRRTGGLADGAAFSFYPAKNLGAFGDAGMVVTDDPRIAERVRMLRDFGQVAKYHHAILGSNARLDTIQAAILQVKLPHLDRWNRQRQAAAARYDELLTDVPLLPFSPSTPGEHVYHLYVVRTVERDRVREALAARGIETGLHYPRPIHLLDAFASLGYRPGAFPNAETLAREALSLPMYPEITSEQQERVVSALAAAIGS
jgi:dTDP-4-amino-4,6-dideoxygalactose transaminase